MRTLTLALLLLKSEAIRVAKLSRSQFRMPPATQFRMPPATQFRMPSSTDEDHLEDSYDSSYGRTPAKCEMIPTGVMKDSIISLDSFETEVESCESCNYEEMEALIIDMLIDAKKINTDNRGIQCDCNKIEGGPVSVRNSSTKKAFIRFQASSTPNSKYPCTKQTCFNVIKDGLFGRGSHGAWDFNCEKSTTTTTTTIEEEEDFRDSALAYLAALGFGEDDDGKNGSSNKVPSPKTPKGWPSGSMKLKVWVKSYRGEPIKGAVIDTYSEDDPQQLMSESLATDNKGFTDVTIGKKALIEFTHPEYHTGSLQFDENKECDKGEQCIVLGVLNPKGW